MSPHPDADALIRAFLDHPTDETPRLVLADWLDDTGRPEDAAWAAYIRARCAADRLPDDDRGRDPLLGEAARHAADVAATLTVDASQFLPAPAAFVSLLPPERLTLRLDDTTLPAEVVEVVPESVARTNRVVALAPWGPTLYLAAADPLDATLCERLEFILNRPIAFVRAAADEIDRAIDAHYPWAETESVTEELIEFPDDPWQSGWAGLVETLPVAQLVNRILADAVRFGAGWIEITPERDAVQVEYRVEDEWVARRALPHRLLPAVATRLAELAGIHPASDGSVSGDGVIALDDEGMRASFAVVLVPLPAGTWVWVERVTDPAPVA